MANRPLTPDTSAGYLRDQVPPQFCHATFSLIVEGKTVVYRCVMAQGHDGNHRDGGLHWESQGVGLAVDQEATT